MQIFVYISYSKYELGDTTTMGNFLAWGDYSAEADIHTFPENSEALNSGEMNSGALIKNSERL